MRDLSEEQLKEIESFIVKTEQTIEKDIPSAKELNAVNKSADTIIAHLKPPVKYFTRLL